ncbi:Os11g0291475 [Oryza sativa Japonica Group]|uniref:Os11g0291475 protein n=1 Tax=Oryza sativa subsp. japonica TaxID=39947 RepID=A0A0N7KSS5_ORYSJ|nr:hypothetical protein EE612_054844 [Oryza sativa]BAT13634.1 Os11g0291475 [Oryza sativa Japonica Group]
MRSSVDHLRAVLPRPAQVLARVDLHRQPRLLPRPDMLTAEPDQLPRRPARPRRRVRPPDEHQHRVLAVHGPVVVHLHGGRELEPLAPLLADLLHVVALAAVASRLRDHAGEEVSVGTTWFRGGDEAAGEFGVAEAVAELVDGVALVEAVAPAGVAGGRVGAHPHVGHGDPGELLRVPCHRQPSAGVVVAEEHLGDGEPAGLAGVPRPQDGADLGVVLGERDVNRPAGEEDEDHRPPRRARHGGDEALLLAGEQQARPVETFLLLVLAEPHEHDHLVRRARQRRRLPRCGEPARRRVAPGEEPHAGDIPLDTLQRRRRLARRAEVVAVQRGGVVGVGADDGGGAHGGAVERERAGVVLEEDDAVLRRLEGEVPVRLGAHVGGAEVAVRRVAPGVAVEVAEAHADGEEVGERPVHVALPHLPLLQRRHAVNLRVVPAVQVQTGLDCNGNGVFGCWRVTLRVTQEGHCITV